MYHLRFDIVPSRSIFIFSFPKLKAFNLTDEYSISVTEIIAHVDDLGTALRVPENLPTEKGRWN